MFTRGSFERVLVAFLATSPLFLVTLHSWSNAVLILGSFFCLIFLIANWGSEPFARSPSDGLVRLALVSFFAPVFCIAVSSCFRGNNHWSDYDSASRFFIAAIVFLFALKRRVNIAQYIQYTAPCSLIISLMHQLFVPQPRLWADRMSTYFADPLVFGYTALSLGLICLVAIHLLRTDSKAVVALKLLGACLGIYLSVMSDTRTGWLAVPLVLALWIFLGPGIRRLRVRALMASSFLVLAIGLFSFHSMFGHRIGLAFDEVASYSWTGPAPENSIGSRITFLRIAWDMFKVHPISGYGDTTKAKLNLPAHVSTYATPESISAALAAGFHNEIVTNAVRFGILGMLSTALLFVGPMWIFVGRLRSGCSVQRGNALMGIVLAVCVLVSSLSTEVFDLKYTASYFSLMLALLCASSLAEHTIDVADQYSTLAA